MTAPGRGTNGGYIEWGYRARFLLRLALIVAAGASLLYLTLFAVFSRPVAGDYGSVFYALRHLAVFLFPLIAFSVLVYTLLVCGATAVLCVYALHKIAGPLYRMERIVETYAAGESVRPVFFRQGDQAIVLAQAFNEFVGRLREDRQRAQESVEKAERALGLDPAAAREETARAMAEVEAALARYR